MPHDHYIQSIVIINLRAVIRTCAIDVRSTRQPTITHHMVVSSWNQLNHALRLFHAHSHEQDNRSMHRPTRAPTGTVQTPYSSITSYVDNKATSNSLQKSGDQLKEPTQPNV